MAALEESVESALKTGLTAEGVTDTFRTFFLDDESGSDEEERTFPQVQITAHPSVPYGFQQPFYNVPVTIVCATHFEDDPKRTTVADLYETVRGSVDSYDFGQHMPAGLSLFVTVTEGGTSATDEHINAVSLELECKVCGVAT